MFWNNVHLAGGLARRGPGSHAGQARRLNEGLIRFNNSDESFADKLPPAPRRDFVEGLEEKRREDEREAREAAEVEEADDTHNQP